MEYGVYAVYDKLNGFGNPMADYNDKSAIRNFNYGVKNQTVVPMSDLELYRLGSYDATTGCIVPEVHPVMICRGVDCE